MKAPFKVGISLSTKKNHPPSVYDYIVFPFVDLLDDFSIEMPVYSRYRTFFFKPLDRENMFEGMKYI